MLINKVYKAVQSMLAKLHKGFISPEDFNSAIKYVQSKKFVETFAEYNKHRNRAMSGYLPKEFYNKLSELKSVLVKLYKVGELTYDDSGEFFPYPEDFSSEDVLIFGTQPINEMTIADYADRAISPMLGVDDFDFISYIKDEQGFITVPALTQEQLDVTPLEIFYFRAPNDPKWSYTSEAGEPVFDPDNSIDLDLPEALFDEIVRELLIYLGVEVKDAAAMQMFQKEEMAKNQINDQIQ